MILGMPASMSDREVGLELLRRHIFVHLGTDNNAKFDFLMYVPPFLRRTHVTCGFADHLWWLLACGGGVQSGDPQAVQGGEG